MLAHKAEFAEWRDNPFTQALFAELNNQSNAAIEQILNRIGADSEKDQWLKGKVMAFSEAIGWLPEFIEDQVPVEGTEDDEEVTA